MYQYNHIFVFFTLQAAGTVVVRLTVIKAKTRPGIEANMHAVKKTRKTLLYCHGMDNNIMSAKFCYH